VPEIPKSGVKIPCLNLSEHTLNFAERQGQYQRNDKDNASGVITLSAGWRRCNDQNITEQIRLPIEKKECELPKAQNLMRVGRRLVWMSLEQPPDGLVTADPNLLTITALAAKIQKCLEAWRPFTVEEIEKSEPKVLSNLLS
jgi:hypothetical protein